MAEPGYHRLSFMDPDSSLAAGAKHNTPVQRAVKSSRKQAQRPRASLATSVRRFGMVVGVTSLAIVVLVGPLTVGGIWDPVELRVADLASRIASTLFHAQQLLANGSSAPRMPTLGELGRGELPFTSVALGFRLFGLRDWAGRLPLAVWMIAALVSQVVWVSRFVSQRAAAWSALVLCTMPLVFFQARFMLGDAVTIATSTLTFVLLSFACLPGPNEQPLAGVWRIICFMAGLGAAALGILCRGLAIGVAVPTLAVALAYLVFVLPRSSSRDRPERLGSILAGTSCLIGLTSAVMAISIAVRPPAERGLLLILQGMSLPAPTKMPTFELVMTQLGHGLFPWSVVLPFALVAVFGRLCRWPSFTSQGAAICALMLFLFLNAAMQTWLVSMGAVFPFPGLAALAIVIGIWLESPETGRLRSRNILLGVITIAVVLLADFDTLPDKLLATATAADAKLPASFKSENLAWLRGCGCVVCFSFLATAIRMDRVDSPPRPLTDVLRDAAGSLRNALGGQLVFFALLIETSLVTGAALVTATRLGLPFQRILYMTPTQRELLTWAWLALPVLVFIWILALVLYWALSDFYAPGFGLPRWAKVGDLRGRFANALLVRYPNLSRLHVSRAATLRMGLFVAGLLLSLGWSSRLSQQLSPRRALNRYHALATRGEPIGLLGVRPQITQYYSKQRPEVLLDPDEAADWILYAKDQQRRWLLVKGDQFARFNATYREKCQCSRNAPVIDGRSSELFLVTNRPKEGMPNENPLQAIALEHAPTPQQRVSGNFSDQVEAIGWDLVAPDGKPVAALSAGRKYELQLYFHVLSRPSLDWEIFVHIDGYGRRYNADHEPAQGLYPMSNWRPGDYIVDRATIDLDPSFTEGNYELYFGLFKGSRRLEVTSGNHDDNRLLAGTIRVL